MFDLQEKMIRLDIYKQQYIQEAKVKILRKTRSSVRAEYKGRIISIMHEMPGPRIVLFISDKSKPKMMVQVKGYVMRDFKQALGTATDIIDED